VDKKELSLSDLEDDEKGTSGSEKPSGITGLTGKGCGKPSEAKV